MRAVIFANGDLNFPADSLAVVQPTDFVIAANGGTHHCCKLGIIPDLIIGDLDSLEDKDLADLESAGIEIVRYPSRKNFTDLELAMQAAKERGVDDILVLAGLGARWDQSLANVLLAATESMTTVRIRLVDGPQEIQPLRGGAGLQIEGHPGDTVSLIPVGGEAKGITTQGLEYPLNKETLFLGGTRGISNVMLAETAMIYLVEGILLIVLIHNRG